MPLIQTIPTALTISGKVLEFCNGHSLDFGERHGLLVIESVEDKNVYNILLSPYKHYSYSKQEILTVSIVPLDFIPNSIERYSLCCTHKGNLFVRMKL